MQQKTYSVDSREHPWILSALFPGGDDALPAIPNKIHSKMQTITTTDTTNELLTGNVVTTDVDVDTDDDDTDYSGWYCIKVSPPRICGNCRQELNYVSELVHHLIVVWPEIDDPNLLEIAITVRDRGRNPEVKGYERSMGDCISYYKWTPHYDPVLNC